MYFFKEIVKFIGWANRNRDGSKKDAIPIWDVKNDKKFEDTRIWLDNFLIKKVQITSRKIHASCYG